MTRQDFLKEIVGSTISTLAHARDPAAGARLYNRRRGQAV